MGKPTNRQIRTNGLLPVVLGCILAVLCIETASANEVTIYQDRFGVSHVIGHSRGAVAYGFGYVIARDRPQQMESFRLRAVGMRAAVRGAGKDGNHILADYRSRLLYGGPQLIRERMAHLSSDRIGWLRAYAAGINRYLDDHADALPYDYKPQKWTTEHVAAICLSLGFESGDTGELQGILALQHLIEQFGPDLGQQLFTDVCWQNDADVYAISHEEADRRGERVEIPPRIWEALSPETIVAMQQGNEALRQEAERLGLNLGSNAWAVRPERSATGRALLHGAPALGLREVPPLYEIHLKGGGMDAAGVVYGGIPAVAIGHNQRVAWSVTSGNCDQIDLFIEELHPDDPGQYRFKGEWRHMTARQESIVVKGGAAQVATVYETVHGPVVAWDRQKGRAVARRRAGYGDLEGVVGSMMEIMAAKDLDAFRNAASKSPKSLNYIYADDKGNIAHFHTGRQMRRAPGHSGLLPVSGTGDYESDGVIPWAEMPRSINPSCGYIAAANNQPGTGYGHPSRGGQWGHISRALGIAHGLQAKASMTLEDLKGVTRVMRTFSPPGLSLLELMVEKMGEIEEARMREAISHLRKWDFRTVNADDTGKFEAAIFGKWAGAFQRRVFARPFGKLVQKGLMRLDHNMTYRLLKGRRAGLPLQVDYLRYVKTADEPATLARLLKQSLAQALADLEKQHGTAEMTAWTRPAGTAKQGNLGKIPDTVRRGTYAMQVSVEPGFPGAESVLFPGNIEDPASPHHADQFALYRDWRFRPMPYTDADIERYTASKITLKRSRP